jgi:translocation and assembly module TamA
MIAPRSPKRRWRRTLTLLLACAIASCPALADPPPPAGATVAPAPDTEADADAVRYRVVIDAPRDVVELLRQSVGLVRWQSFEGMTDDLIDRLARDAVGEAREAVSTVGYFSPDVDVAVDRSTTPVTVTIKVTLGEPTRIHDVRIEVTGPAERDDAQGAEAIARLRRDWGLPQGAIFDQTTWDRAKARAVQTLAASPYAAAALASSEARIDPKAREADLAVEIASGPPFRIGDIEVTGLRRYSADLVRNFSTQRRGDLYSGAALDQFVRRLNGSGYFASVQAVIDTDPANADDATIRTAVIEAPRRKFEGGVGFSTDTRFRINASYGDVDIDGRATQFYADGRIETDQQGAALRFVRPPNARGWVDSAGVRYEQTNLNNLKTKSIGGSVRRAAIEERNQWQFGAAFLNDRQEPEGGVASTAHALYLDVERIWRRVDDLIAPTTGWILDVEAGAGVPGASTRGFGRTIARLAAWYPYGSDWQFSGKLEGGAVFGASRQEVPATLLFRTGGDTTVRGYAFESLGVKDGLATVPGRYYVVSSVEATRWINATWGIAVFVDAGNAFDDLNDFSIAIGYGVGARVRTPIGPFRFDVAYGEESKQVRIHFSVGLAF